jgi:Tfp pilus assembly protein FimT
MVVVAIIGLIAAMGLPAMIKSLQKEGMRKALSDIEDVCFSARQQAIVNRGIASVVFHPQEGTFGVGAASGESATGKNGKVTASKLPDSIHFAMLDIYHKDCAENEEAQVCFYPDGTCDETVIVLVGRGETKKVTLDLVTGTPAVSDVNE